MPFGNLPPRSDKESLGPAELLLQSAVNESECYLWTQFTSRRAAYPFCCFAASRRWSLNVACIPRADLKLFLRWTLQWRNGKSTVKDRFG